MVQSESLAQRFDVVPVMTVETARATVASINQHMNSARALLLELYEQRGWAALGYSSWRECVVAEFDQAQRTLYQQLEAAQIERRIAQNAQIGRIPEGQLRPLAAIPPEQQPLAWQAAQQIAAGREERFSARHVTEAVNEYREEAMNARPAARFNAAMRSSASPKWYTPARILDPARALLGMIDLDPCSNETAQEAVQAQRYYTEIDDGLAQAWQAGTLWMNPPYGTTIGRWVQKLVTEYAAGSIGQALALVPGRTDTDWFVPLFRFPICFVHGRLQFSGYEASAPFPSLVVYLGTDVARFEHVFSSVGYIMHPRQQK
jgi:hypothetical protein